MAGEGIKREFKKNANSLLPRSKKPETGLNPPLCRREPKESYSTFKKLKIIVQKLTTGVMNPGQSQTWLMSVAQMLETDVQRKYKMFESTKPKRLLLISMYVLLFPYETCLDLVTCKKISA